MTATLTYNLVQTSGGLHAPVVTAPVTVTGGAIDMSLGNYYQAAVSGDTTFVLSNIPAGNSAFTLEIQYTGGVITWFSGIQWSNGISPIPSAGTITYTFITQDGGTTWKAIASEVYIPPPAASTIPTLELVGITYNTDNTTVALPAGTAANDLCVYFDHPNTASSSVVFSSVTPTSSSGGAWTSMGGINNSNADSSGAFMWYKILTAADVTGGSVTGRSTASTGYRKKSVAVFRKKVGGVSAAISTISAGTPATQTGVDNGTIQTTTSVSADAILLSLILVSANGGFTTTSSLSSFTPTLYSVYARYDYATSNDIGGSTTTSNTQHGTWVIQVAGAVKYNVAFTYSAGSGSYPSAVRNYLVIT